MILLGTGLTVTSDSSGNFQFSGVALQTGANVFIAQATDAVGNQSSYTQAITLLAPTSGPAIAAALSNDTAPGGTTNHDGLTSDPSISGTVSDSSPITQFQAGFDSTPSSAFVSILSDLGADGRFTLDRAEIARINGGSDLADGLHTLHLVAADQAGKMSSTYDVTFTLKTTLPTAPTFALANTDRGKGAPLATTNSQATLIGQTDANISLKIVQTGATALSTNAGAFQFPGVSLALGNNALTVIATDAAGNSSQYAATIHRDTATSSEDQVVFWNKATVQAIVNDASTPEYASRGLAMVSAAVFDAVNAIDGTPAYYVTLPAPAGASADAAVATASYTVLSYLYPGQQASFDALLTNELATIPDGQSKTDGMAIGQSIASAIIAMRQNDGSTDYVNYVPKTGPGYWQPTAPAFMPAEVPQWATLKPFAMTSSSQFRADAPPALTSQEWADDVNKTLSVGAVNSTTRTADQTQMARFWADGAGTYTPPGHWNVIAEVVAQQQGNSLTQNARMFAELNVALADAAIVAWDAKFTYNTWRPIQVAGGAGTAVNSQVQTIADWVPLITTPPHPEYVSGHSTFSGAASTILTAFFGGPISFTLTSIGLPGVTRSFTSFDQAADEAGESRIYGGIHFEFSNAAGRAIGSAVAAYVLQTFSTSLDKTPPTITLSSSSSVAASSNVAIAGRVLDNLSGVQTLEYQLDGAAFAPVSFDSSGNFSLATSFATDGTADGVHTFLFRATDFTGNVSSLVNVTVTLDTKAPVVTLSSPVAGTLSSGQLLTGTVDGTGSAITALSYNFDGATEMPVSFATDGSFTNPLDLSRLGLGTHTLTVTARDAAGNLTHQSVDLILAAPVALALSSVAPSANDIDVGLTFRPKVVFSRPVDKASVSASDFYLSDSAGKIIPTNIVISDDGTYAWLFPLNPMPGASVVMLTVDGSKIKTADGTLLDAAGNGMPGSVLHQSFTTVSQVALPGTSISGIVADPGVDLKPSTFDDVRSGPDLVLMTGDDLYVRPLAGVTVFILGHEDQKVVTGTDGSFSFASIPSGDVKLVIDGRTATNPPAGYFFPEMVMDLVIKPGQANTVMGSMTTPVGEGVNPAARGVYLPRIATSILEDVQHHAADPDHRPAGCGTEPDSGAATRIEPHHPAEQPDRARRKEDGQRTSRDQHSACAACDGHAPARRHAAHLRHHHPGAGRLDILRSGGADVPERLQCRVGNPVVRSEL